MSASGSTPIRVLPRVLVLMAAYNGSRWIRDQIGTILNQADVRVQLIISDDGSSDDTRAMVQSMCSDGRVALCSSAAATGSAAQNFLGLMRSCASDSYDFVSFADQDDLWDEAKLSRSCSRLQSTGAGGYSCSVEAFWPNGNRRLLAQVERMTANDFLFEGAGQGCTFTLTAGFYSRLRRFLLDHPDSSRMLRYHDWAVYALARVWRVGWTFDHRPMVRYRQHEANDTGAKTSLRGIRKRLALIKSGWYGEQMAAIAGLCFAAAPADGTIARWRSLLGEPRGLSRRLRIARFCLLGGRRRRTDRYILIAAALGGWV